MNWLLAELRFLVIDDSGFTRKMIRNALDAHGIKNVVEAKDAVEGLALLRTPGIVIDAILVDQEMPILSGTDFTRILRSDSTLPNPQVPVIMVTALADQGHVVEARKAGVDAFIAKPFSAESLYQHLLAALEGIKQKRPPSEAVILEEERGEFSRLTFLVIDDSGVARRIVRNALAAIGAKQVVEAEDGAAGLAALRDARPPIDVVLVDREMPVFDGLQFAWVVRHDKNLGNPEVPIVMISGLAEKSHILDAKNAGVNAFVPKPFSPEQLREHIRFALHDPRDFIEARGYVGPDRRWVKEGKEEGLDGPLRRDDDGKWEL